MSIQWEARQFVEKLVEPAASEQDLGVAGRELYQQLTKAPQEDAAEAMSIVAAAIPEASDRRAHLASMICGALVERGMDPKPLAEPLLARLRRAVPLARQFADAVAREIPTDPEDRDAAFHEAGARVAPQMPHAAPAWSFLEQIFPPVIAMMSASAPIRDSGRDLLPALEALASSNGGAQWIATMLRVLDDEPYLAIEVPTRRGVKGRMSGISVNFQLHMLLMDVFPRLAGEAPRLSARVVDVARGRGPQQLDEGVQGAWNMYQWTALQADLSLPGGQDKSATKDWIWNEGTPSDIPLFDGVRLILLGPPAYPREWGVQRDFMNLPAELTVDAVLSPAEVEACLRRIAANSAKD
jgi:hypothetical protein